MTSFIKIKKIVSVDIRIYFKKFVLKELLSKVKKIKKVRIEKKRAYEGKYREYQRIYQKEYQKNYYHTHKKLNKVKKVDE